MTSERLKSLLEYKELAAFLTGIVIAVTVGYTYMQFFLDPFSSFGGYAVAEEVHVHSDFLMYINDTHIDLTDDKYQSRTGHVLLEDFHFHDNNDKVLHRHAENLTLSMFLDSLGYALTDSCLTTDTDKTYCTDDANQLVLFVNGEPTTDITNYIPQERDRILLFYGNSKEPALNSYLSSISADACIYSGTCPEKGTPPPESCGLTCEI